MGGETEEKQSGWTTDTLHQYLSQRIDDQLRMLDERYATSVKALDAAFLAQQTAMRTALEAAEKAVATALSSAEKAVTKAEMAAEKRFESVNEFRAQLTDQAGTFVSRQEAEIRFTALAEKIELMDSANLARISEINKRLDLAQGTRTGANNLWSFIVAGIGVISLLIGVVAFFNSAT